MIHKIKLDSSYYEDSLTSLKTFEIRKNDRDFHVGDILDLWEWNDRELKLTGRRHVKAVKYITSKHLEPGYICMGLEPVPVSAAHAPDV